MRFKQLVLILGVTTMFLYLTMGVFPAISQGPGSGGRESLDTFSEPALNFDLESADSVDVPLAGTFVSTKTIEVYNPFKEYRYFYVAEITGMSSGTFTWYLEDIPNDALSDIYFEWEGGDECTQQSNNNIVCTGGIDYFFVEFRVALDFLPTANTIWIRAGGTATGFSPTFTSTLIFPEQLNYISSTRASTGDPIDPIFQDATTLTWQIPNTTNGVVFVQFNDPSINILNLPVVIK